MYNPIPKTAFVHWQLKNYELVVKGGCNPLCRLKRIIYRVIGGKIVNRDIAVSLIKKVAEKVSCNPTQTANAMIDMFGDWVNDGFNCKRWIMATTTEYVGEYSSLHPFKPIYMCSKCGCLHEHKWTVVVPSILKSGDIALIKKDYIESDLCRCCKDEIETRFNELVKTQGTINKAKQGARDVRKENK